MSIRSIDFHSTVALLAVAASLGAVSTPALAQDQTAATSTESEPIIVTGSRIRRDPLDQEAPIAFVDRDDIDRTGLSSIADVLQ
ncbi:MAG: hypothetical protein ACREXT_16565, partial [Gammaproteobacteria bacterium]